MPILVPLELLYVLSTSAPSGVVSNISPLYRLITIHVASSLSRIIVPPHAAQKRRNVPYQMLLLLEEMQCGKQKAVSPIDFACCLSEYKVKRKQCRLMPASVGRPGMLIIKH